MSSKILAIVPEEIDLGFKLAGIDAQECASLEQAKECIEREILNKRYTLVFIDENFILSFAPRFRKKIQETTSPLIMAIPLKRDFKEEVEAKDYFLKMVQSAIGYEIRIK